MSEHVRPLLIEAAERGEQAGKSAASWAFDWGRMSARDFAYMQKQYRSGRADEIEDSVAVPSFLSGEWAGESINELLGDLIEQAEEEDDFENTGVDQEAIEDAYENAAIDAFYRELRRDMHANLAADDDDDDEYEDDDDEY